MCLFCGLVGYSIVGSIYPPLNTDHKSLVASTPPWSPGTWRATRVGERVERYARGTPGVWEEAETCELRPNLLITQSNRRCFKLHSSYHEYLHIQCYTPLPRLQRRALARRGRRQAILRTARAVRPLLDLEGKMVQHVGKEGAHFRHRALRVGARA